MRKLSDFQIFVRPDGMEPGEAERMERILAAARAILSTAGWIAVAVAPAALPPQRAPVHFLLHIYGVFSLCVLIFPSFIKHAARRPVAIYAVDVAWVALLTTLTNGENSPFFVFLIFVLVSAAYRWRFRETLVTGIPLGVLFLDQGRYDLNGFIWLSAYLLVGLVLGYLIQAEKRFRAETSLFERARIARELHDGVVQSLTGLALHFEAERNQHDSETQRELLSSVPALIRNEIHHLRELIDQLTSVDLRPGELMPFLVDLVEQFGKDTGILARLNLECEDATLPPRLSREIAGIIREALANVRKHARAQNVQVRFNCDEKTWTLIIEDDGRGFDFSGRLSLAELDAMHKGPRTIKERVRLLKGQLIIESRRGAGSRLTVTGPMKL